MGEGRGDFGGFLDGRWAVQPPHLKPETKNLEVAFIAKGIFLLLGPLQVFRCDEVVPLQLGRVQEIQQEIVDAVEQF